MSIFSETKRVKQPDKPEMEAKTSGSLQERVQSLRLPSEIRVPPRRGGRMFWFVILVVFVGGGGWLYATYGGKVRELLSTATAPSATSTAPISTAVKEKVPSNIVLEAGGYIVPVQKVQVSPKVGGQVKELFIEEGTFVEQGKPLAKLEVEEYLFEYRRATALAELAKAKYDEALRGNREEDKQHAAAIEREAEEALKQARDELARLKASGSAVSPDELDKATSRVRIAEHRLDQQRAMNLLMQRGLREERIAAAKAEFDQACAERDKAKWRLDNCTVVAPISGVILEKKTELGNTVRPEAFSNGLSASVCDMADLKNLEVEVDISERDIRQIWRGQPCTIRTEAFADKQYQGQVARIMPVASRSQASVKVRVKIVVPEEEKDLRPEMRARVQFLKAGGDKEAGPLHTTTAAAVTPE